MATITMPGPDARFARRRPVSALAARAGEAVAVVLRWAERARQRRELNRLSDYSLKDLGLSRADIDRELRKPFWRE